MTTSWKPPGTALKTMIHILLDRSGSMHGSESDVIGGVNKFIEEQKLIDAPATIAFTRFDTNHIERFRASTDIKKCEPLTSAEYQPRGGTPLLDAIGQTLANMETDWRREQPDRAIMVIITDGQENESSEYSKAKIKEMIEARQKSDKWAFIYLGADVNAFHEASSMGINLSNAAGYRKTSAGIATAYAAAGSTVSMMRATGQTVSNNLGKIDLGEDEAAARLPENTPITPPSGTTTDTTWSPPA